MTIFKACSRLSTFRQTRLLQRLVYLLTLQHRHPSLWCPLVKSLQFGNNLGFNQITPNLIVYHVQLLLYSLLSRVVQIYWPLVQSNVSNDPSGATPTLLVYSTTPVHSHPSSAVSPRTYLSPGEVMAKYAWYKNRRDIGRLAKHNYFGTHVMAKSTVTSRNSSRSW